MVTQTVVNITLEVVLIAPVGTLQHLPGKRPVQNVPLEKLEVPTKKVAPTVPWENIITLKVAPASLARLESGPALPQGHLSINVTSAKKDTRKTEAVVFLAHYKNIKMRMPKHLAKHARTDSRLPLQEQLPKAIALAVAQANS